jgi:hypothetical protein
VWGKAAERLAPISTAAVTQSHGVLGPSAFFGQQLEVGLLCKDIYPDDYNGSKLIICTGYFCNWGGSSIGEQLAAECRLGLEQILPVQTQPVNEF